MNEAEAFAGLQAATRLALTIGDRALARDADAAAKRIQRGVDRLWNATTGSLDWAVHPNGARQATNWAQLYPDAISQVWAVRYGLVQGSRARTVLLRFLRTHPNAHNPAALDLVDGRSAPTGYWPGLATTLGLVDAGAPARFLAGTSAAAAQTGRAWPYSVQTATSSASPPASDLSRTLPACAHCCTASAPSPSTLPRTPTTHCSPGSRGRRCG